MRSVLGPDKVYSIFNINAIFLFNFGKISLGAKELFIIKNPGTVIAFLKLKYENANKIKNKPDPEL
jgi:hypothetical protein